MSVDIYEVASLHSAEPERERAVEESGALRAGGDTGLGEIVEHARRTFRTSMAAISIVYRDWQYLIATAGLPRGPYSRRTSFCGHVIADRERLICVPDTLEDRRFAANPSVSGGLLLRSYAGAKLLGDCDLPIGVLCVFDTKPRPDLSRDVQPCLALLADEVMFRLDQLRLPPATVAVGAGSSLAA